jgi:hypothetical protein
LNALQKPRERKARNLEKENDSKKRRIIFSEEELAVEKAN